ncbi:MAG: EamA family transporter RarD [Clostridiales bacterium]|nr:EamA family transporter RarD [Clostridiales bacterium]
MPDNQLQDERKNHRTGMVCALGCMLIWGVMPIYWKALVPIDSYVIILYRIVLVGVTCFVAAVKVYGLRRLASTFSNKRTVFLLFIAGLIITANWSTYIYAINSGQTIATCIGYYIDPLVVCIFGMVFFKERPTKYKLVSIVFACIGVLVVVVHFMKLPLIALTLALTFATYTAMKKHLHVEAVVSLFFETVFLTPFALGAIVYLEMNGRGAIAAGGQYQFALLMLAGLLTATPLTLFAIAANRISLISLGILEYIAPSITLLIGIFLFKEGFDFVQLAAFVVIWVGLVFFTYGEIHEKD